MKPINLTATPVGQNFANPASIQSGIVQIISPSSNVNGIIIRTLGIAANFTSSTGGTNIYADTVAPASITDFSRRIIFQVSAGPNFDTSVTMPFPLYLYPGMGLWATSTSGVNNGTIYVTWDYLNPE